ncbi:chitin deacetylase 1 [[Candida] railenensis]|uniref:chitin deacetylase n=1 Tax=[Candida] railenensis TaxID=45579 RepID=A0A9P0W079_9ASCO|nr:chitin deacetylase 1 [[Candida] railenensis]
MNLCQCIILDRMVDLYQKNYHIEDLAPPATAAAVLPFPQWLTDFTGLKEWPGFDPPYIPLDFIHLDKIVDAPLHVQGSCTAVKLEHCSFDCINCIAPDDVYSCPVLSQTFDDGPTQFTTTLLNKLDEKSIKSTFFTLGVQNVKYPEVYRETMRRGHIMGSHTWSHKFLPSLTNEQIIAQLEWSIWSMNATGHHLPKWFRPPFGGIDNRVRSIVRQFGMQNVLWDMDTFDWKLGTNTRKEADILKDVREFKVKKSGKGMILEHDAVSATVNAATKVVDIVGSNQWTVPKCAGGIDYIKVFA